MTARVLRFTRPTGSRTGEVPGITWAEIDTEARLWTCPPERMKGGDARRVPLAEEMLAIIGPLRMSRSEFVFEGRKRHRPLSNTAILMLLRRMRDEGMSVHGRVGPGCCRPSDGPDAVTSPITDTRGTTGMASDIKERLTAAKGRTGAVAKTAPGRMEGFVKVSTTATAGGRFSAAQKEMIATAIAVAKGCEDCILDHVDGARRHGAEEGDLVAALEVAVEMGGGPALMYAGKALEAFRGL
jgi:AhpD family alkylhydroperoxidase